jgi:ketosteroid isomerase-like protein
MISWLAHRLVKHNMERLTAGDIRPTSRMYAQDVQLTFPGDNSWSGVHRSKPELERWLRRFVEVGIQIEPHQVVAQGPPWNTTICVRGVTHLRSPEGETVYENRYVIWGRLAWGLLRSYEVYEDTQKAAALDVYLESRAAPG